MCQHNYTKINRKWWKFWKEKFIIKCRNCGKNGY